MVFMSPLPNVVVPESPLTPHVLARADELSGKAALHRRPDGPDMTYGEFDDACAPASRWLGGERTAKGDVVAIMAPNCPEYGVCSTPLHWPAGWSRQSTRRTPRARYTISSSTRVRSVL